MRSFKKDYQKFIGASTTQPQIYSPSRTSYQNRFNNTENSKNKKRAEQIVSLHEQFEDLKKKIKEVENKNQKIIQKIHRQCNFKKKNPQTYDVQEQNTSPIIYYEKKDKSQISQGSGISFDESNKSDQSQYEFKQRKTSQQRKSVQVERHPPNNFSQSIQYTRNEQKVEKKPRSKLSNNRQEQNSLNSRQRIPNYPQNENKKYQVTASQTFQQLKQYGKRPAQLLTYPIQSQTNVGFSGMNIQNSQYSISIYQLQQNLKIQKEKTMFLQEQLKTKQMQILNLRKSYYKLVNQNQNFALILEDELQNFMQNIVKKGMFEIQKNLKRQQNRMKNLIINVKDEYEQIKSSRIIKQHQLRRSHSRSKKDISPAHNTSINSAITSVHPPAKIPRPGSSSSSTNIQPVNLGQSKVQQTFSKKNKQFQEIVAKYEQMIGAKKSDISKLELTIITLTNKNNNLVVDLGQKQNQIKDMRLKIQELQKLMSQTFHQIPILKNDGVINSQKSKRRISSNQSNLLEDIYNFNEIEKNKQAEFKSKYIEIKQELNKKNQTIEKLQNNMKKLQKQIKNLQKQNINHQNTANSLNNQVNIQKIQKQKHEQFLRNQLTEYYNQQLNQKQYKINEFQNKLCSIQRKLVQKDCEILTLQNKIKKVESLNQINQKKISQYQKLLNHYNQNNISVDYDNAEFGINLLEKSVCYDDITSQETEINKKNKLNSQKDTKKTIFIQISELQNYQKQLQFLNEQIVTLTKKLKFSENSQRQKNNQIEGIRQESSYLLLEKQKLIKVNLTLQQKIKDLLIKQKASDISSEQESNNQDTEQFEIKQKQVYSQGSQLQPIEKLRKNVSTSNKKFMNLSENKNKKTTQQNIFSLQNEKDKKLLEEQVIKLKAKNSQIQRQISQLKQQHLQLQRQNIFLKKNNQYLQDTLSDREQKYQKFRRQSEELKISINQINQALRKKQEELKKQKQQNCQKIIQIEKQWHEFEQQITKNNQNEGQNKNLQNSQILRTSRYNMSQSSILISSTIHNKTSQYLQQQNQYLSIKLKEADATIQMQNQMEQKIINQYKKNIQKLKQQIKQKGKENDNLKKQIDQAKDVIRRLEVMNQGRLYSERKNLNNSRISENKNKKSNIKQNSSQKQNFQQEDNHLIQEFASYNENNNNQSLISGKGNQVDEGQLLYPYEKIIQLQLQLKQSKDINRKLQQMQEQLFKQIKFKQEEKYELIKRVQDKNFKIQQLEQIIQLKQMNILGSNLLGSHISSSNHKSSHKNIYNSISQRQSMRSQSSLRYSGISHSRLAPHQLNQINQSNIRASEQRFQVDLTQMGSDILDRSYLTNISQFFEREQFPYQKAQLKRNQQIKFFEKTASYIKSLKQSINEKNKKINVLQKKIQMLKQNHHGPISQELQNKYEVSTGYRDHQNDLEVEFDQVFKDYESVQLQRKKINHKQMCKSLRHQMKLSIEENNVLSIQIQALKNQLQKAEEQQDNLVMMKDIQKNEIKQLRVQMKNQQKYFKDLIQRQKKKIQESESIHNITTIKQLFIKTIQSVIALDDEKLKSKRQQKRKQIQEFFKIFSSLAGIQQKMKKQLIESIKKLKVNSVSLSQTRASSVEKT